MIRKFFGTVGVLVVGLLAMVIANAMIPDWMRPTPMTQQEIKAIAETEILEAGAALKILKRDFPEDFDVIISHHSQRLSANMPTEQARLAIKRELTEIRVKYAPMMKQAADADLRIILRDNMEMLRLVEQQSGSDACDQVFRHSSRVLTQPFLQANDAFVNQAASHLFEVVRRSIDRPSPVAQASDEDWAAAVRTMLANGATVEDVNQIATAETDPEARNLCPNGLKLLKAIMATEEEQGHRTRSALVNTMMQTR